MNYQEQIFFMLQASKFCFVDIFQRDDRREPPPLEIWVTDIPPTYSFVMGNSTPPPSYGSAILKFPGIVKYTPIYGT